MVLVNPGPFAYFKGSRPNSYLQSQSANAASQIPHATGELRGIGRRVFTPRVSITQVEVKIVVTQRLQVLGQPLSIRKRSTLGDLCVEGCPTPPSKHVVCADATMMQFSNHGAIIFKLRMIVFAGSKHYAL